MPLPLKPMPLACILMQNLQSDVWQTTCPWDKEDIDCMEDKLQSLVLLFFGPNNLEMILMSYSHLTVI